LHPHPAIHPHLMACIPGQLIVDKPVLKQQTIPDFNVAKDNGGCGGAKKEIYSWWPLSSPHQIP